MKNLRSRNTNDGRVMENGGTADFIRAIRANSFDESDKRIKPAIINNTFEKSGTRKLLRGADLRLLKLLPTTTADL